MSHLGDRLSALVDGELSHGERDRLHVHLAACAECRAEAAALRALKRRVGELGEAVMDTRLLERLFALAEPGEPVPGRRRVFPGSARPRPALLTYSDAHFPGGQARGIQALAGRSAKGGPAKGGPAKGGRARAGRAPRRPGQPTGRSGSRRAHYVVAGVVSFVVGMGGLSFIVGGGSGAPGPRINPPVEMFTVEHSVTTGEIPFANPTATFLPTPNAPRRGP